MFGSALEGNWVLDTVLVADIDQQPAADLAQVKKRFIADRAFRRFVLDTLPGGQLRPIAGTAYAANSGDMFSFVPATTDPNRAFARPPIGQLFRHLQKKNGANPSVRNSRSPTECRILCSERHFWEALVKAVTDQGLVLAVQLKAPAA